jgi:hypothetical protein
MPEHEDRSSRMYPIIIAIVLLAPIVYVLSYAPVIRYRNGADPEIIWSGAFVSYELPERHYGPRQFYGLAQ